MTDHAFALTTGTELNHYVIESVLGQGGFGVVYKAHHDLLHETVVIKEFLPVELAGRHGNSVVPHGQSKQALYNDCLQRFLAEGRTLVRLRHPNVVRCRDLFNANGTAYLVMDFEDGLPLDLLIKSLEQQQLRYSEQQLLHFLLPLCDGLDYIHQQGVLHRDIKPANVFIRRSDGSPVIIDFGAAKQNFAAASQSQAPYTEFYAPLEQIEGSGEAKPSVDVHAFGALMYRVVTGQVGPRAEARAMALLNNQPDPLQSATDLAGEHYSAALLATIDRCLAFLPHQRPSSMHEVKQLLQAQIATESPPNRTDHADIKQLDELLELAGADGVITDSEMQMLLNKAKVLQVDALLAQQYIVQRCVQRGWQLKATVKTAADEPAGDNTAAKSDIFSDIFAQHPHNPVTETQNIVLNDRRITLCIERDSPALKSQKLTEYLGIETAGQVFTPIVNRGEHFNAAHTQVFSTAEDQQREVEIHLMRSPAVEFQQATSVSKVKIGLAKPAAAGVPQIEVALYAQGNDLYLDVERLDQPQATPLRPGIAGWLWLVLLALLSKLILSSARVVAFYHDIAAQKTFGVGVQWFERYDMLIIVMVGYVLAIMILLLLFFRCSRYFVRAYIAVIIAMSFIDLGPFPLLVYEFDLDQTETLASVLLYELILLSYLLWSDRVRQTFIR